MNKPYKLISNDADYLATNIVIAMLVIVSIMSFIGMIFLGAFGYISVSYTHLTLPTILLV